MKTKPTTKRKKRKVNLMAKLDTQFSLFIRARDAMSNGYAKCISCSKVHFWRDLQCGHYMSRRYMATRFDEDNCHAQCVACNMFNQGNIQGYRRGLLEKIGEKRIDLVEIKAMNTIRKYSDLEYKELTKYYKLRTEKLRKEKGI